MQSFTLKTMNRFILPLSLLLTVGLSACAPTAKTETTVQTSTPVNRVSFYPNETGMAWSYLLENETVNTTPYVLKVVGPTIFTGQTVVAYNMTGRGADQTWYRIVSKDGVRLLGISKPGVNIELSPAWLEYPAENTWRVGLNWQGQSQLTIRDTEGNVKAQGMVNYSYLVQEKRQINTINGTYEVWVVTRQVTDTIGGLFPATQQLYFQPYVGEVRTPEGLLLTGRNFSSR